MSALPFHLDERLPKKLLIPTGKILKAMSKLEKPPRGASQALRRQLEERCERVTEALERIEDRARQTLGKGEHCGVSFFSWRGSLRKDHAYRNYNSVSGYWRQQTAEYKRWRAKYDKDRKKLLALGQWQQAMAGRAIWKAYTALLFSHANQDVYSDEDRTPLVHGLVDAVEHGERVGLYCDECNKPAPCVHFRRGKGIEDWIDAATKGGLEIWRERSPTVRVLTQEELEEIEFDFGGEGVDQAPSDRYYHQPEQPPLDGWDDSVDQEHDPDDPHWGYIEEDEVA